MSPTDDRSEPTRARPGPNPRLTAAMVTDAVLEVGFSDASLPNVARHLGVQHGALYRYIGDRNSMMVVALDAAVSRFDWPEPVERWSDVLRREAATWWDFCEQHEGFVDVLASVGTVPPSMGRRSLQVAGLMFERGVPAADAIAALDLVTATIHNVFRWASARATAVEHLSSMSTDQLARYTDGIPEPVLHAAATALDMATRSWIDHQIELVVDGVDRHLDAN